MEISDICIILYRIAVLCGCLRDLLSLLQLTPGLYEFRVIVDGHNSHGEGYVNVTVKPGMCFRALAESPLLPLQDPQRWEDLT